MIIGAAAYLYCDRSYRRRQSNAHRRRRPAARQHCGNEQLSVADGIAVSNRRGNRWLTVSVRDILRGYHTYWRRLLVTVTL